MKQIVEKNLAPKRFHNRLPFFAQELSDTSVRIDGSHQKVIDKEIEYAKYAGLDYWAFVTYPENNMLSLGLKMYLSSSYRKDINFCIITEQLRLNNSDPAYMSYIIRLMKEPGYQTVLEGRPLWYLGFIKEDKVYEIWGSFRNMNRKIDSIRNVIIQSGLKNPYLVIMDFNAEKGKRWCDSLGGDAISSYVAEKNSVKASYKKLTEEAEQFRNECKVTGSQVVPVCVAGWNPKPRIDRPNPWSVYYPKEVYYSQAAPSELANHIKNGLEWLQQNKASAESQCAIIYAWNEFDEGGWICPTIIPGTNQINTERIDAIRKVLR